MLLDENSALVALLRLRPDGLTWPGIARRVLDAGSAVSVLRAATSDGALLEDPVATDAVKQATEQLLAWKRTGLDFVSILDDRYPRRLLDIVEAPPFVFADGHLVEPDRGMSIVGSRRASQEGTRAAETAAKILVDQGLTVISGLATGIDQVAHSTALALGARTVAIIGTGILRSYPSANRELQIAIAAHGLVLSQFWPDTSPTKRSFPIRNATMSGYGMATIVVEAGEHSGTRHQARLAIQHGRPVILSSSVINSTEWGKQLLGRPGVHVATSARELASIIAKVVEREDRFLCAEPNQLPIGA